MSMLESSKFSEYFRVLKILITFIALIQFHYLDSLINRYP
jgi:hypothetical protein